MKQEPYTEFASQLNQIFSATEFTKFTSSPKYASEWDESFGPRSHQPQTSIASTQNIESPLAKRNVEVLTNEIPQSTTKGELSRIVTPAKNSASVISGSTSQNKYGKADLAAPTPLPPTKDLHAMDVFWAMINDITGKDKLAKFGQYSLRLLLHHARKSQTYLSDDKVNIKFISQTYTSNEKIFNLLINFIYDPRAFARIIGILVCSVFTSRCAALVPALATFRQILRFGKSPFRIRSLWLKLTSSLHYDTKLNLWQLREGLFTKSTLSEAISLYYSLNDEASLLFKLKFLRNETLRGFAARHEAYAWYCDSWFALYNSVNSLLELNQHEMEARILIQVKKRSRVLSKQILGTSVFQLSSMVNLDDDDRDVNALNEIRFKISNTRLDILKLISDIIFNSYTVFNAPLHFDTVQIWTGISASFLSSVKLYREKRRMLERR